MSEKEQKGPRSFKLILEAHDRVSRANRVIRAMCEEITGANIVLERAMEAAQKPQYFLSDILSRDFIAKVTDAAVRKADDWLSDQLLHDREGINPEWDAYFERVVASFIDRASKVLSEELTLGEDFNSLVETEILPRLSYCDYIDRCKDMRSEIWEESAGIHDPEGLYGVSSEFTIK